MAVDGNNDPNNSEYLKKSPPDECAINTDGKKKGDWTSIYPKEAQSQIYMELWYVLVLLFIALVVIFLNWLGLFVGWLEASYQKTTLTAYVYYLAGGLLGGVTFGGKYLYRVVGRGYWNQDRRVWRIFSPFISMVLGFVIGAMVECGVVDSVGNSSGARTVVIGFLAGYFADEAVGFLCDIAEVVFRKRN